MGSGSSSPSSRLDSSERHRSLVKTEAEKSRVKGPRICLARQRWFKYLTWDQKRDSQLALTTWELTHRQPELMTLHPAMFPFSLTTIWKNIYCFGMPLKPCGYVTRAMVLVFKRACWYEDYVQGHDLHIRPQKSLNPTVRERKDRDEETETTTQKSSGSTCRDHVRWQRTLFRWCGAKISNSLDSHVFY